MASDDTSWRTPSFRQGMAARIEEAIQKSGMPTAKNSSDMENHVFLKAKNKEEYLSFIARLILHVREMNSKKQGGGMAPGGNGPNQGMSDPIGALQTLARQGTGNNQMMGIPNPAANPQGMVPQPNTNAATNQSCRKSDELALSRKQIFEIVKENINDDDNVLFQLLEGYLSRENEFTLTAKMKAELRKLFSELRQMSVEVDLSDNPKDIDVTEEPQPSSSTKIQARVSSSFEVTSIGRKRRKTQDIQENTDNGAYTTHMSLGIFELSDTAKLIHDISQGSSRKSGGYRQSLSLSEISEKPMTKEEALSVVVENQLSKNVYNNIRSTSTRHHCKLYPSYKNVLLAKKDCYPSSYYLTITDRNAEVQLQALLNHTVERILLVQNEVIKNRTSNDVKNLQLICMWGYDGPSGQSSFKQKFNDDIDVNKTDSNIIFTSLVPLRLVSVDQTGESNFSIWVNPSPSSPRFCRPIRIIKETFQSTEQVVDHILEQVRNLTLLKIIIDGKEINVVYKLKLIMVDGKVCDSLTGTSSVKRCNLCKCTLNQFNDIDAMLEKEIEDNMQFGLSTSHMWIHLLECLLHIAYRLETKTWLTEKQDQERMEIRKANIQKGFRQQLGLLINESKQGCGNMNDENTARIFFQNSTVSSSITGINETLIKRFHVILQVMDCESDFEINIPEYEKFCLETARLYVDLYSWYYMPTTVHQLLIHSAKIVQSSFLPYGQMFEKAQESNKKFIKKYQQDFAGKTSRAKNMKDNFRRLLVSSDPFISTLRKWPKRKLKSLETDAIKLIKEPTDEDMDSPDTSSAQSSEDESVHSFDDEF